MTGRAGAASPLFLVDVSAPGLPFRDAQRMDAALQGAVARLRAAGIAIAWTDGIFVPDESRCLCLIQAAHEHSVRHARDVAGLTTASVHLVQRLTGGHSRSDGEAHPVR
jgi:hypothetical protein